MLTRYLFGAPEASTQNVFFLLRLRLTAPMITKECNVMCWWCNGRLGSYVNVVDSFRFEVAGIFCGADIPLFSQEDSFTDEFSHSALICLQLCLFHPIADCCCFLVCGGSFLWIFIVSHMHLYFFYHFRNYLSTVVKALILINHSFLLFFAERFIHVSWNASCKRNYLSLCWATKMKSWPHWTLLRMTQVSVPSRK